MADMGNNEMTNSLSGHQVEVDIPEEQQGHRVKFNKLIRSMTTFYIFIYLFIHTTHYNVKT